MAEGIELLADPTRRKIVALLANRVWHPGDIAAAISLGRPAVSRQLSLLAAAGLIRWRRSQIDSALASTSSTLGCTIRSSRGSQGSTFAASDRSFGPIGHHRCVCIAFATTHAR
jgi:Bacterial regulatory protein, arsR family